MHNISGLLMMAGIATTVALVVYLFWYFSADNRAKRAMRAVPRRAIAEAMEGEKVRVVGRLQVSNPLAAPLSGRLCAFWQIKVEQHVRRGKSSYWKLIVHEEDCVDFLLHDDTGKAVIRTSHSKAVLERDDSGGSGFLNDPSDELRVFLADRGYDTKGWVFNKRLRYREGVAEPGETVAVVGTARWERDPDEDARAGEGYREASIPKRLVMSAPEDGTPLMLSDEANVTSAA